jgi:hypothetical protein
MKKIKLFEEFTADDFSNNLKFNESLIVNEAKEVDKSLAKATLDILIAKNEPFKELLFMSQFDRQEVRDVYGSNLPRGFANATNYMMSGSILSPLAGDSIYVDDGKLVKGDKTIMSLKGNPTWGDVADKLKINESALNEGFFGSDILELAQMCIDFGLPAWSAIPVFVSIFLATFVNALSTNATIDNIKHRLKRGNVRKSDIVETLAEYEVLVNELSGGRKRYINGLIAKYKKSVESIVSGDGSSTSNRLFSKDAKDDILFVGRELDDKLKHYLKK